MSSLLLVLHAHLPWVRGTRAERWLFEATVECYLPLLEVLEAGAQVGLSISPPLAAMWSDASLRAQTAHELALAAEAPLLAGYEAQSRWHRERARRCLARYEAHGRDLCRAFAHCPGVELFTTAATHGFLPLLAMVPEAAQAQITVGVQSHRERFGSNPVGFWLPECGWVPALEPMLVEQGLRYVFVEAHAVEGAVGGVHRHVFTPSGLAAFARDPRASEQVWSARTGYPAHLDYADFHHRVDGQRVLKVTGEGAPKAPWNPEAAEARARLHARHFVDERAAAAADGALLQVAPYDAELFGHWWLEGPTFLREVLALLERHPALRLATPSAWLQANPTAQRWTLPFSTWGKGGDARVWLSAENEDLWPHLHRAAEQMVALSQQPPTSEADRRRLSQAARELLLAQASDWPFLLEGRVEAGFARARVEDHLLAFRALADPAVDGALLAARESANQIFPGLSHQVYRRAR